MIHKVVSCDFEISKENCQRANILSCANQRQARLELIESIKQQHIDKQTTMFDRETKRYDFNGECELRVCNAYYAERNIQQQ